jgi:hypothetical protein
MLFPTVDPPAKAACRQSPSWEGLRWCFAGSLARWLLTVVTRAEVASKPFPARSTRAASVALNTRLPLALSSPGSGLVLRLSLPRPSLFLAHLIDYPALSEI